MRSKWASKKAAEIWPVQPVKAAQNDIDARSPLKIGRPKDNLGSYKSHIARERRFGIIHRFAVIDAARCDGKVLPEIVTTDAIALWADMLNA